MDENISVLNKIFAFLNSYKDLFYLILGSLFVIAGILIGIIYKM